MSRLLFSFSVSILSLASVSTSVSAGIFDTDPAEGGVYVSGFIGANLPTDLSFEGIQAPAAGSPGVLGASADVTAKLENSFYFGGSIGGRLPFKYWTYFQPRLELELSYSEADVQGGSFNNGSQTFSGDQSTLFGLVNSYSDIIWKEDQQVVPYLGGSIGFADVDTNVLYFGGTATAPTFGVFGNSTNLVTISTAGLSYKANERSDIFAEARYYKIYDVEAERRFIAGGADIFNADVDDNIDGLTFTIGTRLNF